MKNILFLVMTLTLGLQCSKEDPAPVPDPCDSVQCLNSGTCDDGTCKCGPWYEGADCGQEVRAKFFGGYTGTLITTNGAATTSGLATIGFSTSVAGGAEFLKVDNTWNIRLSNSAGTFTVPGGQTINGLAVTRGYGAFTGNQVIFTFGGGNQDVTFYGTR